MDSTLACLAAWMPRQRWYAAKSRTPELRLIASWDLSSGDENVGIRTFLVSDESALPHVLYQVPVVSRSGDDEGSADGIDARHMIGSPEPGVTLVDAPHDAAYTRALLRMILDGGTGSGSHASAVGHPARTPTGDRPAPSDLARTSAVLSGEQSNTSIIYRALDAVPIICKIFRQLHEGLNPDIELQTALADDGSPHVPPSFGSIEGEWADPAGSGADVRGSLAFAQEFLPGAEDAWRVALEAAGRDEDFSDRARKLGVATARVHVELGRLFPTRPASTEDRDAIAATWLRRLGIAMDEVPAVSERRVEVEAAYARALESDWPELQRVHGDYHLGQVIQAPGRDWLLLDFEGEPLRPMSERTEPDLALRDVAGMLRSFDYIAGSLNLERPELSPTAIADWVRTARTAFLAGYTEEAGVDLEALRTLLGALELDKAVYEAIYEVRNRPSWLPIPLQAIGRLTERP